ncbi:hypothetical protein [Pedobacter westerhofensis]
MLPILFFNTSVREILKTPQIFLHFIHHHQLDAEIGFIEFLDMHYFGHDLDDNDDDEDMKLPFKKMDGHLHISIGVPAEKLVMIKAVSISLLHTLLFDFHRSHVNPICGNLFRPPISLA